LDETKDLAVTDALGHRRHEVGVRYGVEVLGKIGIDDLGIPVTSSTASWADFFGLNPYEVLQKSASKIGSMTSFAAI
jgi:hypothetical protein